MKNKKLVCTISSYVKNLLANIYKTLQKKHKKTSNSQKFRLDNFTVTMFNTFLTLLVDTF